MHIPTGGNTIATKFLIKVARKRARTVTDTHEVFRTTAERDHRQPLEVHVHHRRRVPRLSVVTAGLTALAVLGLVGCDSDADDTRSAPATGPSVIAPGAPGEENRTLSAEEAQQQRTEDDSPTPRTCPTRG